MGNSSSNKKSKAAKAKQGKVTITFTAKASEAASAKAPETKAATAGGEVEFKKTVSDLVFAVNKSMYAKEFDLEAHWRGTAKELGQLHRWLYKTELKEAKLPSGGPHPKLLEAVANCLAKSGDASLIELRLGDARADLSSCIAVARRIAQCKKLEHVTLSRWAVQTPKNNELSTPIPGVHLPIAAALLNPTVRRIELDEVPLQHEQFEALCALLADNDTLQGLSISSCGVYSERNDTALWGKKMELLAAALCANTSVRTVLFKGPIDKKHWKILQDLKDSRSKLTLMTNFGPDHKAGAAFPYTWRLTGFDTNEPSDEIKAAIAKLRKCKLATEAREAVAKAAATDFKKELEEKAKKEGKNPTDAEFVAAALAVYTEHLGGEAAAAAAAPAAEKKDDAKVSSLSEDAKRRAQWIGDFLAADSKAAMAAAESLVALNLFELMDEFKKADADASGTITHDEFGKLLTACSLSDKGTSESELKALFARMDANKDGSIDPQEFLVDFVRTHLLASLHFIKTEFKAHATAGSDTLTPVQLGDLLAKLVKDEDDAARAVEMLLTRMGKAEDARLSLNDIAGYGFDTTFLEHGGDSGDKGDAKAEAGAGKAKAKRPVDEDMVAFATLLSGARVPAETETGGAAAATATDGKSAT